MSIQKMNSHGMSIHLLCINLVVLVAGLSGATASVAAVAPDFLANLSAGTKLVTRKPFLIRANENSIVLHSQSQPNVTCHLRLREPLPYDRILPQNQIIAVEGIKRSGFSFRRQATETTYVLLKSASIEDLVCVTDHGNRKTSFREFEKAISPQFKVELPENPPAQVD